MSPEPVEVWPSRPVCLYCGRECTLMKPAVLFSGFLLILDTRSRTAVADAMSDLTRCLRALHAAEHSAEEIRLLLEIPAALAQTVENARDFLDERDAFICTHTAEASVVRRRKELEK